MEEFITSLQEILKQHDEQRRYYVQKLEKFEELFVEQQLKMLTRNKNKDSGVFSQDAIVTAIAEFNYMPKEEVIFSLYFRRYKDLYKTDCANWSDYKKIRLMQRKLGDVEHTMLVNHIIPKKKN